MTSFKLLISFVFKYDVERDISSACPVYKTILQPLSNVSKISSFLGLPYESKYI